ncbi:DUF6515 family protein [uncultured Aquimarina sp.]|uniref:DUF6515 family protein n=1 Tax=uncultured Aquimarina sp. TaxID=575652 RepID=UPI002605302E|nr:DUF6515 family protein [uncultured Aquimarina sp.]
MKILLRTLVFGILLSTLTASCATTVKVRPANRVVVTKVHKPRIIVHKNVKYYRSGGVWYIKKNRRYVTVAAPIGARINVLPTGYKSIRVKGVRYYKHKGVYYKKSGRSYIVVNV